VFTWTVAIDDRKQLVAVMPNADRCRHPAGRGTAGWQNYLRKNPFASCDPGRCIATTTVDANLLRELTTSPTAEAVIQGSQGNTVQFTIQLKGFDRA